MEKVFKQYTVFCVLLYGKLGLTIGVLNRLLLHEVRKHHQS